ncbi:DUF3604 domain-containing protein [Oceanicoccus sp. KOV_DT_Chl]|uniref:DUF3604 domain-containing protein n=1 Tax=Oceanicoccus sp. KOV_DT_Chl TaxID=1904639 RepID=UPI000C7B563B|nr:DUF3604 domain-containing protein [Oceanicoccus sp. KOV_DT_Chl]
MNIKKHSKITVAILLGLFALTQLVIQAVAAEQTAAIKSSSGQSFSRYADRQYPTKLLWGDTHLHTGLSVDARAFGATLTPADAFRFARGEQITSSLGEKIQLSRPLDWLVVADHSDGLGAMNEIVAGNPGLLIDPKVNNWHQLISEGGQSAFKATMDIIATISSGDVPEVLKDPDFVGTIWEDYVNVADSFNQPGTFSAVIGYEWTSTTGGNNLHRNVLYRDSGEYAKQLLPFTAAESDNPEDLWQWLQRYEDITGGQILALAHNGNISNGIMFPEINPASGRALDKDYAEMRARWEPLYEVTQIKGDGETHPYLSPNDEFANYETWDQSNLGPVKKKPDMLQYEYAREALKKGLKLEQKLGVNPFKFGMVGSTDSHTGLATAQENNFFGKHTGVEPAAKRWQKQIGHFGDVIFMGWTMAASGYAAVWAEDNSREAIFDAMKRKEVYATTGSRIALRFFGGWEFTAADTLERMPERVGYRKGVPMGGDLTRGPKNKAPTFLVAAMKDPLSGNLDRVQIIKGWLDKQGQTHEQVFDVVWSDNRKPDTTGKLPAVGNTVDIESATWTNTIGATELLTVWEDPDFEPRQRAFYYARVLEIPTPRWTAYDANFYQEKMSAEVPMVTQERAYSSPIWYTP